MTFVPLKHHSCLQRFHRKTPRSNVRPYATYGIQWLYCTHDIFDFSFGIRPFLWCGYPCGVTLTCSWITTIPSYLEILSYREPRRPPTTPPHFTIALAGTYSRPPTRGAVRVVSVGIRFTKKKPKQAQETCTWSAAITPVVAKVPDIAPLTTRTARTQ